MKRLALMMILLSPFLVCDPQLGVETYTVTGLSFATAPVSAQADGSLRLDLGPTTQGAYSLTVKACNVWGCSTAVPFVFSKPSALTAPGAVRLSP